MIATIPAIHLGCQDWPQFWRDVKHALRKASYRDSSLRVYRQVLRGVARHTHRAPHQISSRDIDAYLYYLTRRRRSASWQAMSLSVLRTVFHKGCGRPLTEGRRGPRRDFELPHILNLDEVRFLLGKAATPREALMLSLLYGCGLKPGELVRLRWGDFDVAEKTVVAGERRREVRLPEGVLPLIEAGKSHCSPCSYVFAGRKNGAHLSTRTVERLVARAGLESGLSHPITAMTLRHTYAAHQLEAGMNIRELQEALGHESVATTMLYLHCVRSEVVSPYDCTDVVPLINASSAEAPFYVEDPVHYFYRWMKTQLYRGFRVLRGSG